LKEDDILEEVKDIDLKDDDHEADKVREINDQYKVDLRLTTLEKS
jgi:hypothetical protein